MGSPIVVWPGADKLFARRRRNGVGVPYTLGCAGGATIEEIAEIAPDVFWFQLYRFAKNNHAIGFELVKRARGRRRPRADAHARRAGAHHPRRARSRSASAAAVRSRPTGA